MKAKFVLNGVQVEVEGTPAEIKEILTPAQPYTTTTGPITVKDTQPFTIKWPPTVDVGPGFTMTEVCVHEFPPGSWLSILPPSCLKCGYTPPSPYFTATAAKDVL